MSNTPIAVVEVAEAEYLFGDLFRRSFGCEIANFPRHYVAFQHEDAQSFRALGYIHKTERDGYSLLGGLCVDPSVMRGGIGTALMRKAIDDTDPDKTKAIFAYTKHPVSLAVSLKVGLEETDHEGLIVRWVGDPRLNERAALMASALTEIPF